MLHEGHDISPPPEVAAAIAASLPYAREVPEETRRVLCGYVRHLRDLGVPPERMLVALRTALPRQAAAGYERIVALCIEEYFRPT